MSKHFDSFYESWHGHPRRKRIYDWTIRRYIEVIAIDIGRAPSLSILALYHPSNIKNELGGTECAIVDCLQEYGPATGRFIAQQMGLNETTVLGTLKKRPKYFEVVCQVERTFGKGAIRMTNVWGLKKK